MEHVLETSTSFWIDQYLPSSLGLLDTAQPFIFQIVALKKLEISSYSDIGLLILPVLYSSAIFIYLLSIQVLTWITVVR